MYAFMIPSRIRNAALTEVPMMPPTVLKLPKRFETAAAVAATTMEVMMTILVSLVEGDEIVGIGGQRTWNVQERRMFLQ
jgi:hypothetical protein